MAVWTNPTTRVTEERITQSVWNTDLVENLKYLYNTLVAFMFGKSITKVTVSSSVASVDVTGISQLGGNLIITGVLQPVTDDVGLYLRLNNYSGASDYGWNISGTDPSNDAADNQLKLVSGVTAGAGVGNAAAEAVAFEIVIENYAAVIGSTYRHVTWKCSYFNPTTVSSHSTGGGALLKAEAVNQITFLFESGNIAAGTFRIEITGPG